MSRIDILVPDLPESVVAATIATWHKKPGDVVIRDEVLVEIEIDKVILEVTASEDGILDEVLEDEGTIVTSRQILGRLSESNTLGKTGGRSEKDTAIQDQPYQASLEELNNSAFSPAVCCLLLKNNLNPPVVKNTDVNSYSTQEDTDERLEKSLSNTNFEAKASGVQTVMQVQSGVRSEKRVPMTPLRRRVAERLLEAKNSTAMLTTFNEVNMKPIMDLRKQYGEKFKKRHGVCLGFMSFYVKAVVEALKQYPEVNASIDGDDVIYYNYFDVSLAVSTPRGLITPVLRNVDTLSVSDIEKRIKELAVKGRNGQLSVDDLIGGNFTVTNGGVFGSLMSTPIINPPQSAILGMHAIKERPMAVDGKVEILPMMYLALSYDHRLIDGRESVRFLATTKKLLEDPTCLLPDA